MLDEYEFPGSAYKCSSVSSIRHAIGDWSARHREILLSFAFACRRTRLTIAPSCKPHSGRDHIGSDCLGIGRLLWNRREYIARNTHARAAGFSSWNVRGSAFAAHIELMKPVFDLENWPDTVERIPKTPAGRALESKLVTQADLLRLKVIARLHARGLPPHVGWSDLLQEAFTRVLEGSRRRPADVPMVAFLAEVMRSIKEQYWRQWRRGARELPKLLAELGAVDFQEGELPDPAPSPERRVIAIEQMEAINGLFEEDPRARQVISGLYEGWTPEEICSAYALSRTDYDSTRKRIRRALIRAGLRFPEL